VTHPGGRLDVVVAGLHPEVSRTRAAIWIKEGRVQVEGRVELRPSAAIAPGASVVLDVPSPIPAMAIAQDLPLRIVDQDDDLAVIDKDPGMVVHPAPGHPDGTLVNALLFHLRGLSGIGGEERPGIVHRLDRGTSGLLVVAKHDVAHRTLAAQFARHTAERRYLALVYGIPEEQGTIRSLLARHHRDRLKYASTDREELGKVAITHFRRIAVAGRLSLVGCRLETGRTHQVRVHMFESGFPLVGDGLYKRKVDALPVKVRSLVESLGDRPLLHAASLSLDHPRTGERKRWVAPVHADMAAVLRALEIPDNLWEP
jgi:23S rRNA pseudouridine1911/1915/1917 synthase